YVLLSDGRLASCTSTVPSVSRIIVSARTPEGALKVVQVPAMSTSPDASPGVLDTRTPFNGEADEFAQSARRSRQNSTTRPPDGTNGRREPALPRTRPAPSIAYDVLRTFR